MRVVYPRREKIVAPLVGNDPAQPGTYHNSFQDPDRFLTAGTVAR